MTRITTTLGGLMLGASVVAGAAVKADMRELPDGSAVRFQANPASEIAPGSGAGWVEVLVKELVSKEPKRCREAVGG